MWLDKSFAKPALMGALLVLGAWHALALAEQTSPQADDGGNAMPAIDPAAMAAMQRMGTALRELKTFSIDSATTREVVLESGQKIQLDATVTWKVRQPDKLFLQLDSDRRDRQFYYDGRDLTIYAPRLKFYTRVDGIDASLRDFVLRASSEYGIELPLTDLFFWGTDYVSTKGITSALDVGPGTLGGELIEHYAFRQKGVDWQVWLSQATALPRKLVITTLEDPARPQYSARLDWHTDATFADSAFSFSPPAGASRIKFTPAKADAVQE